MKSQYSLLSIVLLSVIFPLTTQAQRQNQSEWGAVSRVPAGISEAAGGATLVGKLAMEDGSDGYRDAIVVLQCGGQQREIAHVDPNGRFIISLGQSEGPASGLPSQGPAAGAELSDCEIHAESSGYRSEQLLIQGRQLSGVVQVGTIFLHLSARATAQNGFAVSAISLAAPDKAKQNFEKGRAQAKRGKWAAACDYFRKAVAVYPRFAVAWLELGRAQMQQNNFTDAQQSFQQAATQDSKLLPAYLELARVALQQQQWKSLADATDRILELSPESPARFWFLNAAAAFNIGDMSWAERSASRGLGLDSKRTVPQLEYLYGKVMERKQDYKAAIQHIQTYLQLAPNAFDAQQARQELVTIENVLSSMQSAESR